MRGINDDELALEIAKEIYIRESANAVRRKSQQVTTDEVQKHEALRAICAGYNFVEELKKWEG